MRKGALVRTAPSFSADHPFLFVVLDAQFNTVLFMGRWTQPDLHGHTFATFTQFPVAICFHVTAATVK